MNLTPQAAEELKRFQRRARACALLSQLPDDDMDAARDVVRDFVGMAQEAGLLREGVQIYPIVSKSPAK